MALWAGIGLCCVVLVGESVYRAAAFPITHDEALSFAIYSWDHSWADTPANHLLNTQLMRVCARLFGTSELAIRLPNVVAHAVYLGAVVLLLSRMRRVFVVPAFALWTLNLFQFDYFAMARGYGLELAAIAASLWCFVRAVDGKAAGTASLPWFGGALMAGAAAILSNLTAFYFYTALCAVCGWLMVTDKSHLRLRRDGWLPVIVIFGAAGLCALVVINRAFRLQQAHMLYGGGADGFFSDTVVSLVAGSFFAPPYNNDIVRAAAVVMIAVLVLFAALAVWTAWRARRFATVTMLLGTMLAIAILVPMTQHALTGSLLPVGRWALYYMPLAWAMVIFAADAGMASRHAAGWRLANVISLWAVAAAVAGLVGVAFNPVRSYGGFTDTHVKEVLATLDSDRQIVFPGERIAVGNNWELEPILNFYRVTRHLGWLAPATRHPLEAGNNHYLYGFARDLAALHDVPHAELASFPDSGTALWRIRRPGTR